MGVLRKWIPEDKNPLLNIQDAYYHLMFFSDLGETDRHSYKENTTVAIHHFIQYFKNIFGVYVRLEDIVENKDQAGVLLSSDQFSHLKKLKNHFF